VISVVGDDEASRTMWLGKAAHCHAAPAHGRRGMQHLITGVDSQLACPRARTRCKSARYTAGGSKLAAEAGTLTLFAGAETDALAKARPVLSAFATNIIHFGSPSSGALYKLVNNLQAAIHLLRSAKRDPGRARRAQHDLVWKR